MSEYLDNIIPKVDLPEGEIGDWKVCRVEISSNFRSFRERHFQPGAYTQLKHCGQLIMSDTPAERWDHVEFVKKACGDVLISGLGLGMCVNAALRKPEVSSVTVVELATEVINLVGPHYVCDRLEIINADIMEWKPPKGARYGAVWHDIWPDICTDYLPQMATLNRRYARKADWKGCWSEEMARDYKRRNMGWF